SFDRADFAEDCEHGLRIGIAEAEEIEIARGPERVHKPCCHQHRALKDEAVAMLGGAETVKQTLERVAREEQIVGLVALLRELEKPRPHRSAHVALRLRHWLSSLEDKVRGLSRCPRRWRTRRSQPASPCAVAAPRAVPQAQD